MPALLLLFSARPIRAVASAPANVVSLWHSSVRQRPTLAGATNGRGGTGLRAARELFSLAARPGQSPGTGERATEELLAHAAAAPGGTMPSPQRGTVPSTRVLLLLERE